MTGLAEPEPTAVDAPPQLSTVSAQLVDHYASAVADLRELTHRLDHDELAISELRRILGRLFVNSVNGAAVARGFHHSIERLEAAGPVTVDAIVAGDNTIAVLVEWLADLAGAAQRVVVDLASIDALASGAVDHDDRLATIARLGVIQDLATAATARIDKALPPVDALGERQRVERSLDAELQRPRRIGQAAVHRG